MSFWVTSGTPHSTRSTAIERSAIPVWLRRTRSQTGRPTSRRAPPHAAPSGRTPGLASTVNYVQRVWREQNHPINRAALELIEDPEHLYSTLTPPTAATKHLSYRSVICSTARAISPQRIGRPMLWSNQPHILARVREDLDKLHNALAAIAFHLPSVVRDLFPEDHAAEALLAVARLGLKRS